MAVEDMVATEENVMVVVRYPIEVVVEEDMVVMAVMPVVAVEDMVEMVQIYMAVVAVMDKVQRVVQIVAVEVAILCMEVMDGEAVEVHMVKEPLPIRLKIRNMVAVVVLLMQFLVLLVCV